MEIEIYRITGSSNRIMAADLQFKEVKIQPVVVYAHGINGFKDWGGMDLVAKSFAENDLPFFKFNFSHSGTEPENPEEFTDLQAYSLDTYGKRQADLKQVMDFVSAKLPFPISDIYLIGHSRGGTDAILYAVKDHRIKKLVTWAAVSEATTPWRKWDADTMKQWRNRGVHYLDNKRTGQKLPISYSVYEEYRAHRGEYNVERAARALKIPWLICHGSNDEAVFVKDAYDLRSWGHDATEVKIIENTGHTFGRSHPWEKEELPEPTRLLTEACHNFLRT